MSQTFYVTGMTCQSCEVIIERSLKKLPGVKKVSVSVKKHTLEIEGEKELSLADIRPHIKQHGYDISYNRKLEQKVKIKWSRVLGWGIVVFSLYYILSNMGLLTFGPSTTDPAGWAAVFIIGLVASVSSCTAVVGGLVVAISSQIAKTQQHATKSQRLRPHLYFNIGRLIGFAIFGALIGLLGSVLQLNTTMNGFFVVLVAAIMIVLGANLLNLFPSNAFRMPKKLAHKIHDLSESDDPKAPMFLGALTFFLPCGFTQSMQLYALSLQDPFQAAMVMFIFALGTLPALLGIGSMAALSSGKKLSRITTIAGVLVLILGISNAVSGAALLGFNVDTVFAKTESAQGSIITNGKQYIQMEVTDSFTYAPDVLRVEKNVPVEWNIFGGKFLGCANTLVSPGLGINTYIRSGMNTIRFTPTRAGKFTFSCSMGMIRGTMIVTDSSKS